MRRVRRPNGHASVDSSISSESPFRGPLSWSTATEVFTQTRPSVPPNQPDIVISGMREVSDHSR